MANRRFDSSWVIGARLIEIMGSFGTNGSSAPVAASVKGLGFGYAPIAGVMTLQSSARPGISGTPGITHTATGTYLVTFDDSYQDLIYAGADLMVASASANWAQPGPFSSGVSQTASTASFFVINSSGSGQDIAAATYSRIEFECVFRDSTVQFNKP